ncbi:hypothetical protein PNOK_0528700 [Pyrrhoderma noxium]|uniref:Uncharacterized protein n=1 Tax=Pyrrhoderma noxium TaxID=2282107 RepID=A0A286UG55_9AGAM|nr:hypothetical protein PNOK_0528700 [Pyrrhoderma noxium]
MLLLIRIIKTEVWAPPCKANSCFALPRQPATVVFFPSFSPRKFESSYFILLYRCFESEIMVMWSPILSLVLGIWHGTVQIESELLTNRNTGTSFQADFFVLNNDTDGLVTRLIIESTYVKAPLGNSFFRLLTFPIFIITTLKKLGI